MAIKFTCTYYSRGNNIHFYFHEQPSTFSFIEIEGINGNRHRETKIEVTSIRGCVIPGLRGSRSLIAYVGQLVSRQIKTNRFSSTTEIGLEGAEVERKRKKERKTKTKWKKPNRRSFNGAILVAL